MAKFADFTAYMCWCGGQLEVRSIDTYTVLCKACGKEWSTKDFISGTVPEGMSKVAGFMMRCSSCNKWAPRSAVLDLCMDCAARVAFSKGGDVSLITPIFDISWEFASDKGEEAMAKLNAHIEKYGGKMMKNFDTRVFRVYLPLNENEIAAQDSEMELVHSVPIQEVQELDQTAPGAYDWSSYQSGRSSASFATFCCSILEAGGIVTQSLKEGTYKFYMPKAGA